MNIREAAYLVNSLVKLAEEEGLTIATVKIIINKINVYI